MGREAVFLSDSPLEDFLDRVDGSFADFRGTFFLTDFSFDGFETVVSNSFIGEGDSTVNPAWFSVSVIFI